MLRKRSLSPGTEAQIAFMRVHSRVHSAMTPIPLGDLLLKKIQYIVLRYLQKSSDPTLTLLIHVSHMSLPDVKEYLVFL